MGREDRKAEVLSEIKTDPSNKFINTNYEDILSKKIKEYFPAKLERGKMIKECGKLKNGWEIISRKIHLQKVKNMPF